MFPFGATQLGVRKLLNAIHDLLGEDKAIYTASSPGRTCHPAPLGSSSAAPTRSSLTARSLLERAVSRYAAAWPVTVTSMTAEPCGNLAGTLHVCKLGDHMGRKSEKHASCPTVLETV